MRKSIIIFIFIFVYVFGHATAVYKTVSNATAGTLSTNFTSGELTTVTNLTVTGTLDATDFKFMRDKLTVLYSLDISGITIAAYTGTGGTNAEPGVAGTSTSYPADEIPQHAFHTPTTNLGKSTMSLITLPSTIKSIGIYAFKKGVFSSIVIPNTVTAIGANAFQGVYNLTSVTLSNTLTTLGAYAFNLDNNISQISLPASLTSIGTNAFDACSKLATIYAYPVVPVSILVADYVFRSVASNCVLYVPAASLSAYQAINAWNAFTTKLSMTVSVSLATLSGFNYIYGSGPSAEQNFTVSGSNLPNSIVINPSNSFEISTGTGGSFVPSSGITLNQSGGTVAPTTINIRLKAGLPVGSYSNENIAIVSTGLPTQNLASSGGVSPKALTIPNATATSKQYDGTNAAVITGTLSGILNSDDVTLNGTGTFASIGVGTGIAVTSTSTLGGTKAGNYTLTQPTGLTADITAIPSSPSSGNLGTASTLPETDVTIASGVVLNVADNATVHSITVQPGGMLTLSDGKTLTAPLTLQNTASATASFIDANSAANPTAISATVEQDIPATDRNWYVSVPVAGITAADITFSGAKIVTRNEANASWDEVVAGTSLTSGVGYIAVGSTSSGTTSWKLSGNLNSGSVPVTLTASGATYTGFNLVGNPYPSYLNWEQVLNLSTDNATLVQPTIWYRTAAWNAGTNKYDYTFQTYNSTSRISVPTSASGYILPMQAFWVKANKAGTLNFTNSMRSHGDGSTGFASANLLKTKAVQNTQQSLLRLEVNNATANTNDETVLYFNPNARNGYDAYDSPKMMNNIATVPDLYTAVDNQNLVINGMNSIPYDTEIPLGFAPGSGTLFQLKATELTNFDSGTRVILRDYLDPNNVIEQDLTDGTVYSFTAASATTTTNRFTLVFKSSSVTTGINGKNTDLYVHVFRNGNGQITISCPMELAGKASVSVYNAVGQKLENKRLTSIVNVLNNSYNSGVYLVSVIANGKTTTRKVVIN